MDENFTLVSIVDTDVKFLVVFWLVWAQNTPDLANPDVKCFLFFYFYGILWEGLINSLICFTYFFPQLALILQLSSQSLFLTQGDHH